MNSTISIRRYHSLDGLRATMMLLGLVIHSAINYMVFESPVWIFKDVSTSMVFDFILFFIHLFRMPVFFLVAGFFAAFLYYRSGQVNMMKNRIARVLVPLVFAWLILYPIIVSGFVYGGTTASPGGTELVIDYWQSGNLYGWPIGLAHLWFLWDLMIFYVAAIVIMVVVKKFPATFNNSVLSGFKRLAPSVWGLLTMIVITTLTMLPMSHPELATDVRLNPSIWILVAYGGFFAYGWFLFNCRELIDGFADRGWAYLIGGIVAGVAYFFAAFIFKPFSDPIMNHAFACFLCSVSMWMLAYGFIGVFVRHLDGPSPVRRYLADASYWIYLLHLPLTIWIPTLIAGYDLPAFVKFTIVLSVTTLITLASYHLFVRPTLIGKVLNGKKYPRALPRYNAVGDYGTDSAS